MPLKSDLPDDLVHDLEQEVSGQHLSLAEIIRGALRVWKASREAPANERERVVHVLRERGMLCQLSEEFVAHVQPLTAKGLDRLATQAALGGALSGLMVRERRGEVVFASCPAGRRYAFCLLRQMRSAVRNRATLTSVRKWVKMLASLAVGRT